MSIQKTVKKMNNLFDNHGIWTNPKELGYYNFKIFYIEFIETFFELQKEKNDQRTRIKKETNSV